MFGFMLSQAALTAEYWIGLKIQVYLLEAKIYIRLSFSQANGERISSYCVRWFLVLHLCDILEFVAMNNL